MELSNQLRGRCGKRQVPNVRVAMQHNIGIGGACVVALYKRADGSASAGVAINSQSNSEFKSDVIFLEIKERAEQVNFNFAFFFDYEVSFYTVTSILFIRLSPLTHLDIIFSCKNFIFS